MEEKKKRKPANKRAKWEKMFKQSQEILEQQPRNPLALLDEGEAVHNLALLEKGCDKARHKLALANIYKKRELLAN